MTQPAFLALDQGGHSSRARIYAGDGRLLASSSFAVASAQAATGFEQDPRELLRSLEQALLCAHAQLPKGYRVQSAGLATQRSTIVCWDRASGEPLSPAISWQDHRGAVYFDRLSPELRARIPDLTGLVPSPHYGASKLRWCLDHLAPVRDALQRGRLACGPLASFLACRLTCQRQVRVDPVLAARTLLWNRHRRDWDHALLAGFGLPASALPELVASQSQFGDLAALPDVPLQLVSGDQSVVPFAYAALRPADAVVNLGTGAFIQRCIIDAGLTAPGLLVSPSPTPTVPALLEGTVNGAAAALDWLARADDLSEPPHPQWDATGEIPLFFNTVGGLGSPFWHAGLESCLVGSGSAAARVQAVSESILFLLKANLDAMTAVAGPTHHLVVSGGLAQDPRLCERLAALVRIPVRRPHDLEATGRGIASLLGAEPIDLAAAASYPPTPDSALATRFERWRDLVDDELQRPTG